MEHFHSDWTFKPITMLHVNAPSDTLHKEGKPQTFITKEAGCSQSAVSMHVNRKLSGRKKCGRKRCTTNRENRSQGPRVWRKGGEAHSPKLHEVQC